MRVLIGCEESQVVCAEFRKFGHRAYSCDLLDCSGGHPEWHIKDSIFHALCSSSFSTSVDFFGCHPPCDFIANSGVGRLTSVTERPGYTWSNERRIFINKDRWAKMETAAMFFKSCYANLKRVGKGYIENPILHKYAMEIIGVKQTQIIQPYNFGEDASKATCLWLFGLPKLKPTKYIQPRIVKGKKRWANQTDSGQNKLPPSLDRAKIRSKTYIGIARAMAEQWGKEINEINLFTINEKENATRKSD